MTVFVVGLASSVASEANQKGLWLGLGVWGRRPVRPSCFTYTHFHINKIISVVVHNQYIKNAPDCYVLSVHYLNTQKLWRMHKTPTLHLHKKSNLGENEHFFLSEEPDVCFCLFPSKGVGVGDRWSHEKQFCHKQQLSFSTQSSECFTCISRTPSESCR